MTKKTNKLEGIKPTSNREIKEKVMNKIFTKKFLDNLNGTYEQKFCLDDVHKIMDKTIQEKDAEFNKEIANLLNKWIEERGRMAKLLFKKGVKNW